MSSTPVAPIRAAWLAIAGLLCAGAAQAQFGSPDPLPPRRDCSALTADAQIECLLAQMTLAEKTLMISGTGFATVGVPRLGIAPIRMSDGPKGVRTDGFPHATAFPGGVSMAATWNGALVQRAAAAMGEEAHALGRRVLLGPGINIQRYPLGGRNFEYYSEDPYLAGQIGVAWVNGVQSRGVAASPKHFAANNQETNRFWNDSVVDERSLREIYLPAFEAVIEQAHPWTLMAAYNRVNGVYASHDHWLLTEVLRGEWGFDGAVLSDWTSLHDTVQGISAGLDVEMPYTKYYGPLLRDAVENKQVPLATLDESVRRVLRLQQRTGGFAPIAERVDSPVLGEAAHLQLAREVAGESLVLLKNDDGLLPLSGEPKSIAVIGPNADPTTFQGSGSSEVSSTRRVSIMQALREALGEKVRLVRVKGVDNDPDIPAAMPEMFSVDAGGDQAGLTLQYFASADFSGEPLVSRHDLTLFMTGPENQDPDRKLPARSKRWQGWFRATTSGQYQFNSVGPGQARLLIDDHEVLTDAAAGEPVEVFGQPQPQHVGAVRLEAGLHRFRFDYVPPAIQDPAGNLMPGIFRFGVRTPTEGIEAAAAAARAADVALVVVGASQTAETEGHDRRDMELYGEQNALVQAVLQANPRTVVLLNVGGPVRMPWLPQARTLMDIWYPGQEGGHAVADALLGRLNPSGKLPVTFPLRLQDSPAYPYAGNTRTAFYGEGVFVGYRYYDKRELPVAFPFGHGLSYTRFGYAGLRLPATAAVDQGVEVALELSNQGDRRGAEVVQLYVVPLTPSEPRPPRELKRFAKLELAAGARQRLQFHLDPRDFAYWDSARKAWVTEPGGYRIEIGASSRDIRLSAPIELQAAVRLP